MISCSECMSRLYPDDPRVPVGKYHHSACDYYCDKPSYFRELDESPKPPKSRPIVNITYKVNARSTPAFKELDDKITLINGRLTKYFEDKHQKEGNNAPDPF